METGKHDRYFLNSVRSRLRRLELVRASQPSPRQMKLVFLFAFQAEAVNFLIKLAEFFSILHPFGNAFGQRGALAAVERGCDAVWQWRPTGCRAWDQMTNRRECESSSRKA